MRMIDNSFARAQQQPRHPTKPHVEAVEVIPFFPDQRVGVVIVMVAIIVIIIIIIAVF